MLYGNQREDPLYKQCVPCAGVNLFLNTGACACVCIHNVLTQECGEHGAGCGLIPVGTSPLMTAELAIIPQRELTNPASNL